MQTSHRFSFLGFQFLRNEDTDTHELQIGTIRQGDESFVVHLIRKKRLSFKGDFLVSKVFGNNDELLWVFPGKNFSGLGLLAIAGDEVVIALVSGGRHGTVEEVVPLSSLVSKKPVDLRGSARMKELAAKHLKCCNCKLSKAEQAIKDLDDQHAALAERTAKEAAEAVRLANVQRARAERIRVRAERKAAIKARGLIDVLIRTGERRRGYPVVGNEWTSLEHGDYAVLVEEYSAETGAVGPIEAFQVSKSGGKPSKNKSVAVFHGAVGTGQHNQLENAPQPIGKVLVETEAGEVYEVMLYASLADIRKARQAGLNGGTLVTSEDKKVGDKYEVYRVCFDSVNSFGHHRAVMRTAQ